jgi:hypothetical protein
VCVVVFRSFGFDFWSGSEPAVRVHATSLLARRFFLPSLSASVSYFSIMTCLPPVDSDPIRFVPFEPWVSGFRAPVPVDQLVRHAAPVSVFYPRRSDPVLVWIFPLVAACPISCSRSRLVSRHRVPFFSFHAPGQS